MDYQQLVAVMPWTFILQICNLLLQAYLFKRFLLKPVKKIIEERQKLANADLDAAQSARLDAETAKAEYEQHLTGAKEEAAALVRTATVTAQRRGDELVRQAQQEVAYMKQKAEADIAQEKKKAINEVKDEISGIAMAIASKVVEKEIDEKSHQNLVEEFIEKIGEGA